MSQQTSSESVVGSSHSENRESDTGGDISREVAFDLLSNTRRRHVLHHLFEIQQRISIRELATQLAAWEHQIPPGEVSYDQRRRVHTSLQQLHLPKLADAGVVEYSPREGSVTLTETAADLERYLELVPHESVPWSVVYLGLSVAAACGTAGSYLGVFPLAMLSGIGWATLAVVLLGVTAALQYRRERHMRQRAEGTPPIYY